MKPGWRWVVVGAAVLLAALAASAWYKQRSLETPQPAPSSRAGAQAVKPAPADVGTRKDANSSRSPRDRPERERADRP